jgi:sugar-phosphatase
LTQRIFDVDAFAFDMDGTLIESREAIEDLWRQWASERGFDEQAVLADAHGRSGLDNILDFEPDRAKAQAEFDRLLADLVNLTSGVTALPGAASVLSPIPVDRWTLVTASTGPISSRWLKLAGLPLPALSICSEHVARGKPDPEGFLAAAAAMKVSPARMLVFEDSENGLKAARAAGCPSVGLGRQARASGLADHCLDHYLGVAVEPRPDGGFRVRLPA